MVGDHCMNTKTVKDQYFWKVSDGGNHSGSLHYWETLNSNHFSVDMGDSKQSNYF